MTVTVMARQPHWDNPQVNFGGNVVGRHYIIAHRITLPNYNGFCNLFL